MEKGRNVGCGLFSCRLRSVTLGVFAAAFVFASEVTAL
jgi:hypothetical protein